MNQVVSRESLEVLATLIFLSMNTDPESRARPEWNIDCDSIEALSELLKDQYAIDGDKVEAREFFGGYALGAQLGLAVAAAIVSNGFDTKAAQRAVKAEIVESSSGWPSEYLKPKEAA